MTTEIMEAWLKPYQSIKHLFGYDFSKNLTWDRRRILEMVVLRCGFLSLSQNSIHDMVSNRLLAFRHRNN